MATLPARAATPTIRIDGNSAGRTFDGVGAISGGGGNSRLLIDYPEPQRSRILDYLFKPGYGAALQILKVEIGGDTNSTDGSESSHEHARGDINCNAGYEWWLMEQAKARNPNIKLYALAWGAPGWVGRRQTSGTDMIGYLLPWLGCAQQHDLRIDYLGGWNEKGFNADWYVKLHAALASHGYGYIKIVADDSFELDGGRRAAERPGICRLGRRRRPALRLRLSRRVHRLPEPGRRAGSGQTAVGE